MLILDPDPVRSLWIWIQILIGKQFGSATFVILENHDAQNVAIFRPSSWTEATLCSTATEQRPTAR